MKTLSYCPECGKKTLTYPHERYWTCPDCGLVLYNNVAAATGVLFFTRATLTGAGLALAGGSAKQAGTAFGGAGTTGGAESALAGSAAKQAGTALAGAGATTDSLSALGGGGSCGASLSALGAGAANQAGTTFGGTDSTEKAGTALVSSPVFTLLVEERAKEPGKGKLGLPGGFVDPGEGADGSAMRECAEELGLTPENGFALDAGRLRYLASFPNTYDYKDITYHTCDMFYTYELTADEMAQVLSGAALQKSEVTLIKTIPITPETDASALPFAFNSAQQAVAAWLERDLPCDSPQGTAL